MFASVGGRWPLLTVSAGKAWPDDSAFSSALNVGLISGGRWEGGAELPAHRPSLVTRADLEAMLTHESAVDRVGNAQAQTVARGGWGGWEDRTTVDAVTATGAMHAPT